ncbi:CRISPR-associated helicase Cas3' [Belnapia sp. T18]|uniref:CRISPR-associated helicase Cas3 n=2 Tax=Belnapia arida TaxID=2804533 RepID=A0ABS1UCL9_9PROT|nr:CRISPR-associated helicase Cas3' [Belnapia arida]
MPDTRLSDYLQFWGKAEPKGTAVLWHPAALHMCDVAAVAEVMSDIYLPTKMFSPDLKSVVVFLAAMHDIGKLSRSFQAVEPKHWPAILGAFVAPPRDDHHTRLGYRLIWRDRRVNPVLFGPGGVFEHWPRTASIPLIDAAIGHHGAPVDNRGDLSAPSKAVVCDTCVAAIRAFITHLTEILRPARLVKPPTGAEAKIMSWHVAGLITLADWIGSSREWFPYQAPDAMPLSEYWLLARQRARVAVQKAGIIPAKAAPRTSITGLFPKISDPTAVQRWADTVELPSGPFIAFIEDMTGSGKSEAGVTLAHRMMAASRAQGIYFALPTMATANAMYQRFGEGGAYRRLFAEGADPSLVLTHGKRDQHEGFRASILRTDSDTADREGRRDRASAPEWVADSKRTAFFADVGVGSIDQALMAALPTQFAPMRMLGLSRRILTVDEAHAYDSFTGTELDALLQFQASLGGSTIVLSATLPLHIRQRLADAFRKGLSLPSAPLSKAGYPLTTLVSAERAVEEAPNRTPRELDAMQARSVTVERVVGRAHAFREITEAANRGAAVAWVRNTVDDAVEAAELLRQAGYDPILFHSRFTVGDRQEIEERVLATFGPDGRGRAGQIVVATQVIEQSLDIDFDLIVSDLAPIDALIQRAGRLWRHRRDGRPVDRARFLVLSPDPMDNPPEDWIASFLPGTAGVYRDPAVLWRSARCLLNGGDLNTPEGVRCLVAEVYAEDALVPDAMKLSSEEARSEADGDSNAASYISLDPTLGYRMGDGHWVSDEVISTRMIRRPQAPIRIAWIDDRGALRPWNDSPRGPRMSWALSEVTVPADRIRDLVSEPEDAVADARKRMAKFDRAIPIVALRGNTATLRRIGRKSVQFFYHKTKMGLRLRVID